MKILKLLRSFSSVLRLSIKKVNSYAHILIFVLQKIDGFLAVLSVTGGNFSPKSQKLPFSVTSIDGDNYLLYCASIDLAGNSPSTKCRRNSKEDLCIGNSRSSRSRLRIPVKGRIQLVLILPLSKLKMVEL